ncbi:MAG: flagellar basal body-associated FliL family protein [Betaproteobacteria bacterium]
MAEAKKAETEVEAPPPKPRGKLILFIAIGVLVLVLIGGGAAYFLMKKKPAAESVDGEEATSEVKPKKKDKKGDHSAAPSFYKFDKSFTVKLQTEQQEAYLQAEVQLRVLDATVMETLKQFDPELKHRIMLVLLGKKASDLVTAPGVQRLSIDIRDTVNNTLEPPPPNKNKAEAKESGETAAADAPVQAVLFTSFIIQ